MSYTEPKKDIVLYYGHAEFPDKNALAHRVLANSKLIESLEKYKVVLIGGDKTLCERKILSTKKLFKGFETFSFPYPATVLQWIVHMSSLKSIKELVKEYEGRIKIVIITGVGFLKTLFLLDYAKRNDIVLISDTVDWFPRSNAKFPLNIIKDLNTNLDIHIGKKLLKNLIVISSFLEKKYSNINTNIIRIPSLTVNSDLRYNTKLYIPDTKYVRFVYAGSPGLKERMDFVIKAACMILLEGHNIKLIVLGITQEYFVSSYPNFEYDISSPFFSESILFLGRIEHQDCLDIIQSSDFSTFAREVNIVTNSGFPTKFSESLACRTPVITTPTSDLADFVENGSNGYLSEDCSFNEYLKVMKIAASLNISERNKMHEFCRENPILDYLQFYDSMNSFLLQLKK